MSPGAISTICCIRASCSVRCSLRARLEEAWARVPDATPDEFEYFDLHLNGALSIALAACRI